MRLTLFTLYLFSCAGFILENAIGIPIAKAMGCGQGIETSREKRAFCCEQFNLNCAPSTDPLESYRRDREAYSWEEANESARKASFQIRTLGERCSRQRDRCAVGLKCKGGFCLRERTKRHLNDLLERGKLVEEEERGQLDPGTDLEKSDPLPPQKGLILEGQSVKVKKAKPMNAFGVSAKLETSRKILSSRQTVNSLHNSIPGKKPTLKATPKRRRNFDASPMSSQETVIVKGQAVGTETFTDDPVSMDSTPDLRRRPLNKLDDRMSRENSDRSKGALMEEEDELAANIVDFLKTRLGVALDSTEMHDIRELIAGTLDERAEREDEVVENLENDLEFLEDKNERNMSSLDRDTVSLEYKGSRETRYEPLLQCDATAESGTLDRGGPKRDKNIEARTEGAIHLNL